MILELGYILICRRSSISSCESGACRNTSMK